MEDFEKNMVFEKVCLGYQTATELVALVSEEIYNRFNAMLTANSIIIAIIGLILLDGNDIFSKSKFILMIAIIGAFGGILLCILWFLFINHGVYWQNRFREEAIRLEKAHFLDTFHLFSDITTEGPYNNKIEHPRLIRWFSFYRTSLIIIFLFYCGHLIILSFSVSVFLIAK